MKRMLALAIATSMMLTACGKNYKTYAEIANDDAIIETKLAKGPNLYFNLPKSWQRVSNRFLYSIGSSDGYYVEGMSNLPEEYGPPLIAIIAVNNPQLYAKLQAILDANGNGEELARFLLSSPSIKIEDVYIDIKRRMVKWHYFETYQPGLELEKTTSFIAYNNMVVDFTIVTTPHINAKRVKQYEDAVESIFILNEFK